MPSLRHVFSRTLLAGVFCIFAAGASASGAGFSCDVVVIGAGGAGMSAAATAAETGVRVIVLEKMPRVGGNTLLATGSMMAVRARSQSSASERAESNAFYEEVLQTGGGASRPELVHELVTASGDALDWLVELGADLVEVHPDPGVREHSFFTPGSLDSVGSEITETLLLRLEQKRVPVLTQTRAEKVLRDKDGRVSGVEALTSAGSTLTISAPAVVIATGGFASAPELLARWAPEAAHLPTSNAPGATGDGLKLAADAGGALADLGAVQFHPTALPLSGVIVPQSVRRQGAILLSSEGKRFVNELAGNDVVSAAIEKVGGSVWMLADEKSVRGSPQFRRLISTGSVIVAHDDRQIAMRAGISYAVLSETLRRYRMFAIVGRDVDFGRPTFESDLSVGPYFLVRVRPALHGTTGGIVINERAEVLDADGAPVPGLFAAGETTAGVHGRARLEGAALTDAIVFGRRAGLEAAHYAVHSGEHSAAPARPVTQLRQTDSGDSDPTFARTNN